MTNIFGTHQVLHWYFGFPQRKETDAVQQTTLPDSVVTERVKERKTCQEVCQPLTINPTQQWLQKQCKEIHNHGEREQLFFFLQNRKCFGFDNLYSCVYLQCSKFLKRCLKNSSPETVFYANY